jgi:hypothetical protein
MLRPNRGGRQLCRCGFLWWCEHVGASAWLENTRAGEFAPRKPVPPHTTSFFFAAEAIVKGGVISLGSCEGQSRVLMSQRSFKLR